MFSNSICKHALKPKHYLGEVFSADWQEFMRGRRNQEMIERWGHCTIKFCWVFFHTCIYILNCDWLISSVLSLFSYIILLPCEHWYFLQVKLPLMKQMLWPSRYFTKNFNSKFILLFLIITHPSVEPVAWCFVINGWLKL